jgi:hypothetical protein
MKKRGEVCMQEKNRMTSKRTIHYYLLTLLVMTFFCAEYNSPLDSDYKGSYEFSVTNFKDTVFIVFQEYLLNVDETSGRDTFYNFTCAIKDENSAVVQQINKTIFNIVFYKPCSTTVIYITGIHPNDKKDSKEISIKVINPYRIVGKDTVAHNDTVPFNLIDTLNTRTSDSLKIRWFTESDSAVELSKESAFNLTIKDSLRDFMILRAELSVDKIHSLELSKKVLVRGWTPRITDVQIKIYNPLDTSRKVVNQVDSFEMLLSISDKDSDLSSVTIKRWSSGSELKKITFDKCSGECTIPIILPPITDTLNDSLIINAIDSQGYSYTEKFPINIKEIIPKAYIKSKLDVAYNFKTEIQVESPLNCAKFIWVLSQNQNELKRETNSTGRFVFGPFTTTGEYILKVIPVNGTGKPGDSSVCIINAKKFTYTTVIKEKTGIDTLYLKVNRSDTLHAFVTKDTIPQANSIVKKFHWTYPPSLTPFIAKEDSLFIVKCTDSIGPFTLGIECIVDADTASKSETHIVVSRYSPIFQISKQKYDTTANSAVAFKYTIGYTDTKKSPASTFYYRFKNKKDSTVNNYDTAVGILFNDVGFYKVEMWCVDGDGAVSNIDSISLTISADLPYIYNVPKKVSAINKIVTIDSVFAKPGNSESPIKNFLWDRNNDGVFDTTTLTGSLALPAYSQPKKDTITVKCVDGAGKESRTVPIYIDIFSDIPKIDIFARSDLSTVYKGLPVKFNVAISDDPNDTVWTFKIFGNDSLLKKDTVKKSDTISLNIYKAGRYDIKAAAIDSIGHCSDTIKLSSVLTVDPGNPVVNNIKIPNGLVYIKDAVQCTVSAVDYNGKISKYQYYVNDSIYKEIPDSVFSFVFADSGMKKITVKVVDNDSLISEMKSVSIFVSKGQPVVESFSVDKSSIYVNDSCKFKMVVSDVNGRITRKEIKWNDKKDSIAVLNYTTEDSKQSITDSVTHKFFVSDTSLSFVHLRVMDEDSIYSEWKACSLSVKKGIPKIDTVKITPVGTIFIRDTVTLAVSASDPNNTVKLVAVSWLNNGTFEDLVLTGGSKYQIKRPLLKVDTNFKKILIRVTDTTNFTKDTLVNFAVLAGYPIITDVSPDTVWALKDTTFKIKAIDPDTRDAITKRSFDWDNNGNFEYTTTADSASHKWDTLQGNDYTGIFKVMVEDNDTMSTAKTCTVFVKIGRPVLSLENFGDSIQWVKGTGSARDTMFYKWKNGDSYVIVSVTDPNGGNIVRYDWDRGNDGTVDYPNTNSNILNRYFVPNTAELLSVRARDNDSLWSSKLVFYVFPDAAPQIPTLGNVTIQGDSVKFVWQNADLKDGDSTHFQIQCDTISTPVKIAKPFGTCKKSGTDFYYWFKPTVSGRYYWKVTAKDARGSTSESAGTPYFDFVKP